MCFMGSSVDLIQPRKELVNLKRRQQITQIETESTKSWGLKSQTPQSIQELWDNIKWYNRGIVGIPEGKEREWGSRNI